MVVYKKFMQLSQAFVLPIEKEEARGENMEQEEEEEALDSVEERLDEDQDVNSCGALFTLFSLNYYSSVK